jgi:hypothetical protein
VARAFHLPSGVVTLGSRSGRARCGASGDLVVARVSCRAKALRFGADDGDARGRRSLREDVVVVLLSVPRFRVKTLVYFGLGSGGASRRLPS